MYNFHRINTCSKLPTDVGNYQRWIVIQRGRRGGGGGGGGGGVENVLYSTWVILFRLLYFKRETPTTHLSCLWKSICRSRCSCRLKHLLQRSHWNLLKSECISRIWLRQWVDWEKLCPQILHTYGLTPVCQRWWICSEVFHLLTKVQPGWLHG